MLAEDGLFHVEHFLQFPVTQAPVAAQRIQYRQPLGMSRGAQKFTGLRELVCTHALIQGP
jgi:hypothetical protein